jgi:hypothetical protein
MDESRVRAALPSTKHHRYLPEVCERVQFGLGKRALEQLLVASSGAMASMRDAEWAAKVEADNLRKILKEQEETHATALAGVREVVEKTFAPQL